jgi:DnaJ-domain-containing protein 1
MDRLFDKLGDLLHSLLGSSGSPPFDPRDPDMRQAMEELDAYLASGGYGEEARSNRGGRGPAGGAAGRGGTSSASALQDLRRDYAALEVPFAAPLPEVRQSYKRLLNKYHPDRFSEDTAKQALATEVTQHLNAAFSRIEKRLKGF